MRIASILPARVRNIKFKKNSTNIKKKVKKIADLITNVIFAKGLKLEIPLLFVTAAMFMQPMPHATPD